MTESTPYSVPQEPGRWRAIALAVLMHAALFAFLWIGIRWQSETPVAVEAEVWNVQPKEAAPQAAPTVPREPEPMPEPNRQETKPAPQPATVAPPLENPDIVLEQEKKKKAREDEARQAQLKEKAEKERLARLKEQAEIDRQAQRKAQAEKEKIAALEKQKREAEKKRMQAMRDAELAAKKKEAEREKQRELEEQQLAELRNQEMRRISGSTAGTGGSGTAAKSQGLRGDPDYAGKVATKIKSNTAFAIPANLQGNPYVEYDVQLFPDGTLRGAPRKVKSSGIPAFDEAVRRAIELSQPFPADKSGAVPSSFRVTHQPKEQ
jgi:colicin import membrane protein